MITLYPTRPRVRKCGLPAWFVGTSGVLVSPRAQMPGWNARLQLRSPAAFLTVTCARCLIAPSTVGDLQKRKRVQP